MEDNDESCFMCEYELTSTRIFNELKKAIGNREITKVEHILNDHLEFKIHDRLDAQTLILRVFNNTHDILQQQASIIDLLKLLLDNGANINAKDRTQQTVLHLAAKYRLTLVIDFLLRRGADLQTRDKTGNSILHFLIKTESQMFAKIYPTREDLDDDMQSQPLEKDSADFIQWMILKGLDVDYRNENGETSLHWAANFKLLHILPVLLEYTRDTSIVNNRDMTPFQVFVEYVPKFDEESGLKEDESRWHKIYEIFLNKGFSVDVVDKLGSTPLHHILNQQRFIIVKLMLKNFKNVDANDKHGNQVLHIVMNNLKVSSLQSRKEYLEIVRTLISKGANVNQINNKGTSPLIEAVLSAELTILQIFKEHGADFHVIYKGSNLLYLFCKSLPTKICEDSLKILYLLLDEGIDVNAEDKNGMSPLHFAVRCSNINIIEKLIECGADVNSKELSRGYTPLHTAVENNCEKVVVALIENEAEIDAKDDEGKTPLYLAVRCGNINIIEKLIEIGADVNSKELSRGYTPLHKAVENNCEKTVVALIENEAEIDAKDDEGKTPLYLAVRVRGIDIIKMLIQCGADVNSKELSLGYTPLHKAVENICEKAVIVLIDNEAEIDAKDDEGRTPLYIAAQYGLVAMTKKLIEYGANIECRDFNRGYTPLHEVVANNRQYLVKILFDSGANFSALTKSGQTLLHFFEIKDDNTVEKLINYGAPIDLMDNEGLLPLHTAILHKDGQLVKELLKFGADINDNANVLKEEDYASFSEGISHQLMKLKVARLFVDKIFASHIPGTCGKHLQFYRTCSSEVKNNLKTYKITDSLSLYDVLHINKKSTCNYVENVKLKELIDSYTFKREFPMYHDLISAAYHTGVQRRKMFEPAKEALNKLANLRIPELCIHEIFCYLKNFQLRSLIAAAEKRT